MRGSGLRNKGGPKRCVLTGNGARVSDDPSSAPTSPRDCPPRVQSSWGQGDTHTIVPSFLVVLQTSTAHPAAARLQSGKSLGYCVHPGKHVSVNRKTGPFQAVRLGASDNLHDPKCPHLNDPPPRLRWRAHRRTRGGTQHWAGPLRSGPCLSGSLSLGHRCAYQTHMSLPNRTKCQEAAPIHTQGLSAHSKQEGIPPSPPHLPASGLRGRGPACCRPPGAGPAALQGLSPQGSSGSSRGWGSGVGVGDESTGYLGQH